MLATLTLLVAQTGGHGDSDPDDGVGLLLVLGSIAGLVIAIAIVVYAFIWFGRRESGRHDDEHPPGSVGRVR